MCPELYPLFSSILLPMPPLFDFYGSESIKNLQFVHFSVQLSNMNDFQTRLTLYFVRIIMKYVLEF